MSAWRRSRNRANGGRTLPFLRKLGSTGVLASMSSSPQNQGRSKPYAGLDVTRRRGRPTRAFEEICKHARIIGDTNDHWLFAASNCNFLTRQHVRCDVGGQKNILRDDGLAIQRFCHVLQPRRNVHWVAERGEYGM